MNKIGLAFLLVIASASCFLNSHNVTLTIELATLQKNPDYVQNIDILLGADLTLILYSNGSTGSLWTDPAGLSDPLVLEQTGHRYVIRPNPNAGEAGHEVFTFMTRSRGTCSVYLEYGRPAGGDIAFTCTINVEVK
ncbi:MAG TPA: protease inhibitor I42 family protein [Acidobacteriota bacterium]|nr:protease inhibitor I42 family protein [Acidobacteriota bacterium]